MAAFGKRVQVAFPPGVSPIDDETQLDTLLFTYADKVRFQNGKVRKIGGWQRVFSEDGLQIQGAARTIYSYYDLAGNAITLIGTHNGLYAYVPHLGNFFYNITPLQTDTINIPDAFSTEYNTGSFQMTTVNNSPVVQLSLTNYFLNDSLISISGVSGTFNGIPASAINGQFSVQRIHNSLIEIRLNAAATVSGSVQVTMNWAAPYLYVNATDSSLDTGERVKITLSDDVANIPASVINKELIATSVIDGNNFIIQTGVIATSKVTAAGGADTLIQYQIASGAMNASLGYGYGGDMYGTGLYGVPKTFTNSNGFIYPRIWSFGNYNGNAILTPGDGNTTDQNLYLWNDDLETAPTLIANAPNNVRYVFTANNLVCTLGSEDETNYFANSDAQDVTIWTPGPSNLASNFYLEDASLLVASASARDKNLIFTLSSVYVLQFVGVPNIWNAGKLMTADGIIGPNAFATVQDSIFWMGKKGFYAYDGFNVVVLPNNTVKRYVFDNINNDAAWISFAFVDVSFNEIWFFYPAGQDTECNNYVIFNYQEQIWYTGTMSRSAAERPINSTDTPLLIQSDILTAINAAGAFNTYFYDLYPDPFSATDTTNVLSMFLSLDVYLEVGDIVNISGATDTCGIPANQINGPRPIVAIVYGGGYGTGLYGNGLYGTSGDLQGLGYGSGLYGDGLYGISSGIPPFIIELDIEVGANATSSGTGGGSAVTMGTAILGLTLPGSNLNVGDLITVTRASAVNGMSAAAVNAVNVPIRYVSGNTYQYKTDVSGVYSTSSVFGEGGNNAMVTYPNDDILFKHEVGLDDYNYAYNPNIDNAEDQFAPMKSYVETNYASIGEGDNTMIIYSIYPDTRQTGDMTISINTRLYAQSPQIIQTNPAFSGAYTISPQTTKVDVMAVGRERQYRIESNVLGGNFLLGKWYEEIKESSTR